MRELIVGDTKYSGRIAENEYGTILFETAEWQAWDNITGEAEITPEQRAALVAAIDDYFLDGTETEVIFGGGKYNGRLELGAGGYSAMETTEHGEWDNAATAYITRDHLEAVRAFLA